MKRFASTRSEKRASHPGAGRAQWSVGSIDDEGIRYGLTTHALIASTIATAPTMVTIQSTAMRMRRGRRPVTRSSGWWNSCSAPGSRARTAATSATRTAVPGVAVAGTRSASATRRPADRLVLRAGSRRAVPPCRSRCAPDPLASPRLDPAVIAREEDLRDGPAAELGRPCVVRVLEPAVERRGEALDLARPFRQRAGRRRATASTSASAGISPPERRTARSRRVGAEVVEDPLVEALEAGRQQRERGLGRELLDERLVELSSLRRERDDPVLRCPP